MAINWNFYRFGYLSRTFACLDDYRAGLKTGEKKDRLKQEKPFAWKGRTIRGRKLKESQPGWKLVTDRGDFQEGYALTGGYQAFKPVIRQAGFFNK